MNKIKSLLLSFCFIFFVSMAYAGIAVDPAVTNVNISHNSKYTGSYIVKNTYNTPITIIVEAVNGNSFSKNRDIDVSSWLTFKKYKYYLKANESVTIPYTIDINNEVVGSISARVNFNVEQKENQILSIAVSVPIYVTIIGTENIDFSVDSIKIYTDSTDILYKLTIENKGNVHIRHSGIIELYSKNKKTLLKTISIPETLPTYCENKREFYDTLMENTNLNSNKFIAIFKIRAFDKEVVKEVKFKIKKDGTIKVK